MPETKVTPQSPPEQKHYVSSQQFQWTSPPKPVKVPIDDPYRDPTLWEGLLVALVSALLGGIVFAIIGGGAL